MNSVRWLYSNVANQKITENWVHDETRTRLNDLCFTRIDGVPFYDFTNTLLKGVGGRTLIMRADSYCPCRVPAQRPEPEEAP